jgi:hypothetical protein
MREIDDLEERMRGLGLEDYKQNVMTETEYRLFKQEVRFLDRDSIKYDLLSVANAIIERKYFVVDYKLKTLQFEPTFDQAVEAAFGDKPPKGTRSFWPVHW